MKSLNISLMRAHKNLIYISVFILGILLGYFSTEYTYFNFEKDINLIEVIGIAINILLAYFISKVLEKRKTEDRIEKDILIDKLKTMALIIAKISIEENKIDFSKANSIFKELSIENTSLKETIDYMEIKIERTKLESLKKEIFSFKKLVTSQTVANNKLQFEDITANRVLVAGRQLKDSIFKLIIDYNRL